MADIIKFALKKSKNKTYTIATLSHYDEIKVSSVNDGKFSKTKCIFFGLRLFYFTYLYCLNIIKLDFNDNYLFLAQVSLVQNNLIDLCQYWKLTEVAINIMPALQAILDDYLSPEEAYDAINKNIDHKKNTPKPLPFKENTIKLVNGNNYNPKMNNMNLFDLFNFNNKNPII